MLHATCYVLCDAVRYVRDKRYSLFISSLKEPGLIP